MERDDRTAVLSVGRAYCDLIFTGLPRMPTMGTEIFADGLGLHAGGGAVITAAAFAALGRPSHLAAYLPKAPFGPVVRTQLERAQVGLTLAPPACADADPQVTVALSGDADRAFVTRRTGPAFPPLTPDMLAALRLCHMHIGELATLVEAPQLLDLAAQAEMSVSLDCAWDDRIAASVAAPLIAAVDVFLPSDSEAAWLDRIGVPRPFAPLTVIKRGASGAEAHVGGTVLRAPARGVAPVDTTGAGDAFNAGFLDRWLDGAPLPDCLAAGNAEGRRAILRQGGLPESAPV